MAMIDYGAIVIKNGKITTTKMFEDMEQSVGWSDEDRIYIDPISKIEYKYAYLYNNYYAYIGDKNFTLAFHKHYCRISWYDNTDYLYSELSCNNWKSHNFSYNGINFNIKEICPNVYLCSLIYKGNRYKVIYGYGIDTDFNIWNKCKISYLGKKNAKKVDNLINRLIKL